MLESTVSSQQLQYACDLANRGIAQRARTDAVQMKCKVGRLCNGRCIPQKHKCLPSGGLNARHAIGAVGVGALGGAALLAAAAYKRNQSPGSPKPNTEARQEDPRQGGANQESERQQRYERIKKESAEAEQKNGFGKKVTPKAETAQETQERNKKQSESDQEAYKNIQVKTREEAESDRRGKKAKPSPSSPEEEAKKKEGDEFKKHLSDNPQKQEDYQKAVKAAHAKHGMRGAKAVHNAFKKGWQGQNGSPNPKAPQSDDWHLALGVDKEASPDQVKKAYRDLSRKHHPDKSKDPEAAAKFEAINAAYKASKQRKDSLKWQSIEQAYQAAQQHHDLLDSAFWSI